jgi:lipoyl(octanoyl) transferase
VIDHFDFSREVVSVSIHYLDRFLAAFPVNKKTFQLAAMTTLYLAIKVNTTLE